MAQDTMAQDERVITAIGTPPREEDEKMNVVTQSEKSYNVENEGESSASASAASDSDSTPAPRARAGIDSAASSSASAAGAAVDDSKRRRREETAAARGAGGQGGISTDGAADDDEDAGVSQVTRGMNTASAQGTAFGMSQVNVARASASASAHGKNAPTVEDQTGDVGMSQVMGRMDMASGSAHGSVTSSVVSDSSSSTAVADPTQVAARQRLKWRMNLFVFVQVLMKYLEKVDPKLCTKAKKAVKECSRKKNAGDPAYKSLAVSIQVCLRQTVGEYHWVRAEQLMRQAHFRSQRSAAGGGAKPKA